MNNIKRYKKYKPSGIAWLGDVPEHWEVEKLKHIFTICKTISGELGHKVLSITQNGIKVKDTESGGGQLSMDYSKYQIVNKGDFAMNHMDLLTGYVDISNFEGVTSPDYRVFKLKRKFSNKEYLLFLLQLGYKLKLFYSLGQGVSLFGRWRLPSESFNHFKFPIPSLDEQTAIANFLDYKSAKIDRFIKKKKQLIKLLNEQKAGIINDAVTKGLDASVKTKPSGIEWAGDIPEHWEVEGFNKNVYLKHGFQFREEHFSTDGIRVVKITQLSPEGSLRLEKASYVPLSYQITFKDIIIEDRDILMALTGGTIGKIIRADINEEILLQNYRVGNFYPINDKLSKDFLYLQLKSDFVQKQMTFFVRETGQPNIGKGDFRKIKLIVPSLIEQKAIVSHIETETAKLNQAISTIEKEIALVQEYKTALIAEAVTGKIDVRDYVIPEIAELESYEEIEQELSMVAEDEEGYGINEEE